MAILLDEKQVVNENVFKYENRLKSPVSRFIDTTPTFTTYYHIKSDSTTVDEGFQDISSIIGFRSPLRFNKIEDFPLYGMEQIVLQLQDGDQGLDANFEGEVIVIPGTIKPLQNDFFMIPYLKEPYIFRVTEVNYDTIMPDNYYKISYKLEWLDTEKVEGLENQVKDRYTCILENIGTEKNCLIEHEDKTLLDKIEMMYDDMAQTYVSIFYNDRHNCFLGEIGAGLFLYDPLQTQFVNEHQLFNRKNNLMCLMLTDQINDNKRKLKYERSVYRFIERRRPDLVNQFMYDTYQGSANRETSFARWAEDYIFILDNPANLSENAQPIFSNEFVMAIKTNGFVKSQYAELIKRFSRGEKLDLSDIPLNLNDELLKLDGNLEVFFFTPIIMYIIQTVVNEYLSLKK